MARLIEANFAQHIANVELSPDDAGTVQWVLSHTPTVDAVPVVHGRWEKSEYNGFLRCDHCKDVYIPEEWLEDGKWNYCPNCGAHKDLEVG